MDSVVLHQDAMLREEKQHSHFYSSIHKESNRIMIVLS